MAIILNSRPLSLAEVGDLVKKAEDFDSKPTGLYLKAFSKLSFKDAKELADKVRALNSAKVKETHIVKLIDLMPQDAEDVHKIFSDVSLSEDEVQSILQTVKKS